MLQIIRSSGLLSWSLVYALLFSPSLVRVQVGAVQGHDISVNFLLTVLLVALFLVVALKSRNQLTFRKQSQISLIVMFLAIATAFGVRHPSSFQFLSALMLLIFGTIAFFFDDLHRSPKRHQSTLFGCGIVAAVSIHVPIPLLTDRVFVHGLAAVLGLIATYSAGALILKHGNGSPTWWWLVPPVLIHSSAAAGRRGPTSLAVAVIIGFGLLFVIKQFPKAREASLRHWSLTALMLLAVLASLLQPNFADRWRWSPNPQLYVEQDIQVPLFAEGDISLPFGLRTISFGRRDWAVASLSEFRSRPPTIAIMGSAGSSYSLMDRKFPGMLHPHNDYLKVLLDYGLVGLVLLLGGLILSISALFRVLWRTSTQTRIRDTEAVALLGALSYTAGLLFVENLLVYTMFLIPICFILARTAREIADKSMMLH